MHVQVVTYGLAGMSEREYLDVANTLAPRFSAMPGLLAKLWLANAGEGRYGAVYLWDDREAMQRFVRSELFEATNPEFSDIAVEDFEVLGNLTAETQPVLELVQSRRQRVAGLSRVAPAKEATRAPAKKATKAPAKKAPPRKAPPRKAPATATKKSRKRAR